MATSACTLATAHQDFDPSKPAAERKSELCRFNMHSLACQQTEQVKYRGLTCYHREEWLERAMGWAKRRTRDKITSDPAHVAVSVELDRRGLQRAALELGIQDTEADDAGMPDTSTACVHLSDWTARAAAAAPAVAAAAAATADGAMIGSADNMPAALWQTVQVRTLIVKQQQKCCPFQSLPPALLVSGAAC